MLNIDLLGLTGKDEPFDNKLVVYVPSISEQEVQQFRFEQWRIGTIELLTSLFGGATSLIADGYWKNNKLVVSEQITLVYSNFPDSAEDKIKQVISFVRQMAYGLKQECISLEINGTLLFID